MAASTKHPLIVGARVTSLGTLASRVLGMLRDMATASLLGMSGGGAMDAFVVAFRIPNLFRRLFGEGALTASYLPVLSAQLEHDPRQAWKLVSVMLALLAVFLAGMVVFGELLLGLWWLVGGDAPETRLLLGLAAVMMPYAVLICLAAQMAATLHSLSHFTAPALAPTLLNLCWLAGALLVAPYFAPDRQAQAYVLAVAVLLAGFLQLGIHWPVLRRYGFVFDFDPAAARPAVRQIFGALLPTLFGLAVTQINTLADSLIAWGLAATPASGPTFQLAGRTIAYPLEQGAAAAIYYGERLYQFPLGILGIAVATAIFPLLSRHAARGQRRLLGEDLSLGLRLVVALGLPAGVGLMVLAEPLVRLLFERGQFTADDTARTARMVSAYASAVWAYCALPVVVRGYYALGDRERPVRVGTFCMGLNLGINAVIIWRLAEVGLAVGTAAAASVQAVVLVVLFSWRKAPLPWRPLLATIARAGAATAVMAVVGLQVLACLPAGSTLGWQLLRVGTPLAVSMAVYALVFRVLGGRELGMLFSGRPLEPEG
jgi:putative peptidoglycan lipid II flippase